MIKKCKVKQVSSETKSDSDNSDFQSRNKKSPKLVSDEANAESSIIDNSDQEIIGCSESD